MMEKFRDLLIYSLCFPVFLSTAPVTLDNGFKERFLIGSEISYFEDRPGSLLFGDLVSGEPIEFTDFKNNLPSFHISKSVYWIKLDIENRSVYGNYYLEIPNSHIDEIRFYYFKDSWNEIGEGDENENKFSIKKTNNPLFPLFIEPGESKTYYIRIRGHEYLNLPFFISREPFVSDNVANQKLYSGFYNGAILSLLLYNIVLLLLLREKIYVLSSVYIFFAYITFNYLYGSLPDWDFLNSLIPFSNSLINVTSIFSIALSMEYFQTKENAEKVHLILKIIIIMLFVFTSIDLLIDRHFSSVLSYTSSIFLRFFFVFTGVLLIRKCSSLGRLYTLGWFFLIVGIIIQSLPLIGFPQSFFSLYSLQTMSIINLILISLSIVDKVYEFKKREAAAISQSIKTIEETKKILERENKNFEAKVDERTKYINYEKLLLEQKNNSLEKEITMAGKLQESLMPSKYLNLRNISYSYLYKPMMKVGGDFIDLRSDSGQSYLGIFICDISGHGIVASMIASMVKIALQDWEQDLLYPTKIPDKIHNDLKGKLDKNFLTAIVGCINLNSGEFKFSNAGHPPLIYIPMIGELTCINSKGKMIMEALSPKCEEGLISLKKGDKIILYTDGITEIRNIDGEILDEEGFIKFLELHRKDKPEILVQKLGDFLVEYSGNSNPEDDCAMLVVEFGSE